MMPLEPTQRHCLVTGGAGFIGSELVRQLVDAGNRVTVVDNLVNGQKDNLTELPSDKVNLVVADVREQAVMARLLAAVDVVYHLACLGVRHSLREPYENHAVNAEGTLRLLQAARQAGVGRFVHVSSSEVYGTARHVPMTEEHPTFPRTVYGASKLAGECYVRAFHETYGLPVVIVRPFNSFGPRCHHEGDSGEVIPKFLLRALAGRPLVLFGDGKQTRDFTYVADTARGILLAGQAPHAVGATLNLGSGQETAIDELARCVARVVGGGAAAVVHDDPRPGDVLRLCADSSRARQLLGFRPTVSLEEGLRRLKDWYAGRGCAAEHLLEHEVVRNWERNEPQASEASPDEWRVVPVAKPWLDETEVAAAARPILNGWVAQGPEVLAFEREFAAAVGARHACAVSSCSAALQLALRAVGVGPGSEVVTVSHSFIATANAVRHVGATPVFVDIRPDTFNIDPEQIKRALTARTRAILCVHQLGMPCELAAILEIARRHGLPVVEDAACAVGSQLLWNGRWEPIGKPHGDVACFSFHPRKVLTTGEGGMLTTASAELDRLFRLRRHQGMDASDWQRHQATQVILESYPVLGHNFRMTDIQAAVGRAQLQRLPEILERRRMLAARYQRLLMGVPGLIVPDEPDWARSNWQSYCVLLAGKGRPLQVLNDLRAHGISARRAVMCAHREPAYADVSCPWPLPISEDVQDRGIILPLYPQLSEAEQDQVVNVLASCLRKGRGSASDWRTPVAYAPGSPPPVPLSHLENSGNPGIHDRNTC